MKLETCIKPRKDGVVNVNIDGANYTFKPGEAGGMVADITNEAHLAYLLQSCGDNFMPIDPSDFDAADKLASVEEDDEDEDEDETESGAPIEVKRRGRPKAVK